jgi:1-phosphatidylinositol-4-phosphate 5-kinase
MTLVRGAKVRFVVMGNLFCTDLEIHRRYDLKGSTLGRYTPGEVKAGAILKVGTNR